MQWVDNILDWVWYIIHPISNQLRDVAGAAYEDCPKTVFTTPKEFCNFSIVIGGTGDTFTHVIRKIDWHWGKFGILFGGLGAWFQKILDFKSSEISDFLSC